MISDCLHTETPSDSISDFIFATENSCDEITDHHVTPGTPSPGAHVGMTVGSGKAQRERQTPTLGHTGTVAKVDKARSPVFQPVQPQELLGFQALVACPLTLVPPGAQSQARGAYKSGLD